MNEWQNLLTDKPAIGQRCIVWHWQERRPVFAYFDRAGHFYIAEMGHIIFLDSPLYVWWMPAPEIPVQVAQAIDLVNSSRATSLPH